MTVMIALVAAEVVITMAADAAATAVVKYVLPARRVQWGPKALLVNPARLVLRGLPA